MRMHLDNGAVDHNQAEVQLLQQAVAQGAEDAVLHPAMEASINSVPGPKRAGRSHQGAPVYVRPQRMSSKVMR